MPASAKQQAEVAARRDRALQLRAAGMPYQAIAGELGYRSRGAAAQDVTRALRARQALPGSQRDIYIALELERLDLLERAVQSVMRQSSADGERSLVLRAADRLLRIAERRAALLGLDMDGKDKDETAPVSPLDELRARRERKFTGG